MPQGGSEAPRLPPISERAQNRLSTTWWNKWKRYHCRGVSEHGPKFPKKGGDGHSPRSCALLFGTEDDVSRRAGYAHLRPPSPPPRR